MLADLLAEPPDWQVTAVADGSEAVRVLASMKLDLVVLDLNLPQCNGLEVYRRLHASAVGAQVPVLLLTATMRRPTEPQDLLGPHVWLSKPFDVDEVLQAAATLLGEMSETGAVHILLP